MIPLKLCRTILIRFLVALALISSFPVPQGFCQESEDSQVFISGFNAYQQKNYAGAIEKLNEVLQKHPETPLRDMALFWLARAYFKSGNQQDAARFMSQFTKEYPDNPLKSTVEEELLALAARYERGEHLPAGTPPAKPVEKLAAPQKTPADKDRLAGEQAEIERQAEQARSAKAEEERVAALKAEQERVAALKAEEERRAAEHAEQQRLAQDKAAQEKLAAEKGEQQRLADQKIETDRKAAEQARMAAAKAEQERIAVLKAEEKRAAAAASEAARLAAARHEQQRVAAEKAASEAEAARVAAARKEQERLAAAKAEEQRLAKQREAEEKARIEKAALREKAIAQYKSTIEKYPASKAAAIAVAKLKELGIAVALPPQVAASEGKPQPQPENAQVLKLEVAQFAGFEFRLLAPPQAHEVAQRVAVPFEIINRGNGNDSFGFESGFPVEFAAVFASAATPDQSIKQSPILAPGETFKGVVSLVIPAASIDGLRITHPIKAVSRSIPEATQSREVGLTASAPLLRAVLKADKTQPLPGEKITYRIAILNVGSTAARNVTFRLDFPPQLEPVEFAGFKFEPKAALVFDPLQVNSGESKEFTVVFKLKDDSLAGQELLCHAELINNPLKTSATFISNLANVRPTRGIQIRSGSNRIVTIPGQTLTVPFTVANTGNIRDKFRITSTIKGAQEATIFLDLNRDGTKQAGEPVISEVGPLEPKEQSSVVMEIQTSRSEPDRAEGTVQIAFSSEGDSSRTGSSAATLIYSRPVLQLSLAGRGGRLKPEEVASFDLTITNSGSNLARIVELKSTWPEQLELIASNPGNSAASGGNIIWNFKEVGAGEKRTIKVSFRVKPGTGVGTNIQVANVLAYEDQLGNRY